MPNLLKRARNLFGKKSRPSERSSAPEDHAPGSNAAQQEAMRAEGRAELLRARRGAAPEAPTLDGLAEEDDHDLSLLSSSEQGTPQREAFQVMCRGLDGGLVIGGLTAAATARELKEAVAAQAGTPDDGTWYLTHGSRPLRDDSTLGDLGIGEGASIVQNARISGGFGERA